MITAYLPATIAAVVFHVFSHYSVDYNNEKPPKLIKYLAISSNILIVLSALTLPDMSDIRSYMFFGLIRNPSDSFMMFSYGVLLTALVLDLTILIYTLIKKIKYFSKRKRLAVPLASFLSFLSAFLLIAIYEYENVDLEAVIDRKEVSYYGYTTIKVKILPNEYRIKGRKTNIHLDFVDITDKESLEEGTKVLVNRKKYLFKPVRHYYIKKLD